MFFNKRDKVELVERDKNKEQKNKANLEKNDFWALVLAAYKAILPFVIVIVLIYFLVVLFITKVLMR